VWKVFAFFISNNLILKIQEAEEAEQEQALINSTITIGTNVYAISPEEYNRMCLDGSVLNVEQLMFLIGFFTFFLQFSLILIIEVLLWKMSGKEWWFYGIPTPFHQMIR